MPGTVKIWWHDGAIKDVRYNDLPVVSEPELGHEALIVGPIPVASSPAPADATVAVVECDVNVRYRVLPPGTAGAAGPASKPVAATGFGTDTIGVRPGARISFIES